MENEPQLESRHGQIVEQLPPGKAAELFGGLDFEHHLTIAQQVDALASDRLALVEHIHPHLTFDEVAAAAELITPKFATIRGHSRSIFRPSKHSHARWFPCASPEFPDEP